MIRLAVTKGLTQGSALESSADIVRIGRAEGCDLLVPDDHVSGEHARIEFSGVRHVLRDNRSTNGTAIVRGGERIPIDDTVNREQVLESGDVIELGSGDRLVQIAVTLAEDPDDSRIMAMRKIDDLGPAATSVEKDTSRLRQ